MDEQGAAMVERAYGFATVAKNELRKLLASVPNLDMVDLDRFQRAITNIDLCRSELNTITAYSAGELTRAPR